MRAGVFIVSLAAGLGFACDVGSWADADSICSVVVMLVAATLAAFWQERKEED